MCYVSYGVWCCCVVSVLHGCFVYNPKDYVPSIQNIHYENL